MLGKLGTLIGLRGKPVEPAAPVASGKAGAPDTAGTEILRGSHERRNFLQGIRDALTSMSREEKDELVDDVLARLSLFVFDLPASEKNHHARRFGLLDHLLEVAFYTARELSGPSFQVSPEPSIQHREGPRWAYGGVIAAIAHDIGKPLDLEIVAPGSGTCWDPRREPLKTFCDRHGLTGTGPELWHFRPGRGMRSHERSTQELLPLVLPPAVDAFLGPRLSSILQAMSEEDWAESPDSMRTAREVVRIVRRIDQASAMGDSGGRDADIGLQEPRAPLPATPSETLRPVPPASREGERLESEAEETVCPSGPEPKPWDLPYRPFDHFEDEIQKKAGKGDPVERERWLQTALVPSRFLKRVRGMILRGLLSRNGLDSDIYVQRADVWIVLPNGLRKIAQKYPLPFDRESVHRMIACLGESPQVEWFSPRTVPCFIQARPDTGTVRAIRIRCRGFLSDVEVKQLGVHHREIQIVLPDIDRIRG